MQQSYHPIKFKIREMNNPSSRLSINTNTKYNMVEWRYYYSRGCSKQKVGAKMVGSLYKSPNLIFALQSKTDEAFVMLIFGRNRIINIKVWH